MEVTVGICAHNEEGNIGKLIPAILNQQSIKIKDIIVVSSGSTDKTNEIVEAYKQVNLIKEAKRTGKVSAINKIIKLAKTDIIVLISADVIPKTNTLNELCKPFFNDNIGITGGRPKPINSKKSLIGFTVHVVWGLHHLISKETPKFGECIAFRKVFGKLPKSAVDEEEIASQIENMGLKGRYVPSAIIKNKGPLTIKEFISQRRRIYAGHLTLKSKTGHCVPTLSNTKIALLLLKTVDFKAPIKTAFAISLEGISRLLGYYDYLTKKDHTVWEKITTTKKL